jgi:hypothetical protein
VLLQASTGSAGVDGIIATLGESFAEIIATDCVREGSSPIVAANPPREAAFFGASTHTLFMIAAGSFP